MKWLRSASLPIIVAVALLATACGNAGGGTSDAGDDTLARIRAAGKAVVALEAAFEPFDYLENGEHVGYNLDILDEIAKDMEIEIELIDLPFQGILPGLLSGQFDFTAAAVGITAERAENHLFTLPVAVFTPQVLVRKDRGYTDITDLAGKPVGTQLNSAAEPPAEAMDAYVAEHAGEGFTEIKKYVGFPECYLEVENGRIEGCVNVDVSLGSILKRQPDVFDILPCPEGVCEKAYIGFVVRPEDVALRDEIDKTIRRLNEEGILNELSLKWIGVPMEVPTTHVEF